uniref:Uncharacterized protein n=1 Tax=Anguilla anguilla TaxID=7936 RepID=A0A0E9SU93_ANGAN
MNSLIPSPIDFHCYCHCIIFEF